MQLIESPAAALELLRRRDARRGLLTFTGYTFPAYQVNWHHRLKCEYLDRFARGEIKRLMIFEPPQHGKSELVSRRLPAKLLGDDPNRRIIACSYTAGLSSAMNRDVQRIMDSREYRRLYPATQLFGKNVRSDAHGSYLRNSEIFEIVGHRGFYKSAGVGGGITGRPMDVGLIDDPIKGREEADSPILRDKIWAWYNGDFLSRAHGGTQILLTSTRWHENDLPGRLLKLQEDDPRADKWTILILPAICESPGATPGDPRQAGEALWPAQHPLEMLEQKRASSPYDFASLYQQKPRVQGLVEWPDEYFGPHIWFDDWPEDLVCRAQAIDPSKGKSDKSGDYSALVDLGVDRQLNLWVDADLDNGRPIEPLEGTPGRSLVEDAITRWMAFRSKGLLVETNGFQEWVAKALLKASKSRNLGIPLYTINNTIPKEQRIRTLGTYLAQRRLRVRKTKGGRLLVQQLRDFPTGTHDDGPDALKMAEQMADYLMRGKQSGDQVQLLRA